MLAGVKTGGRQCDNRRCGDQWRLVCKSVVASLAIGGNSYGVWW